MSAYIYCERCSYELGSQGCDYSHGLKCTCNQPDSSKREDFYHEEFGSTTGIRFNTSEGIKKLEPGKVYDRNINEIKDAVLGTSK